MPIIDLLERSKPGISPAGFLLGFVGGAAAYGLALLAHPEPQAVAPWMCLTTAAFLALAGGGQIDQSSNGGVMSTGLATLQLVLGGALAVLVLVMLLPASWFSTELDAFASQMPIKLRVTAHSGLAEAASVYGPYLKAGGLVALASAAFGGGGGAFVSLLYVLSWAVLLGEGGRKGGGLPASLVPTLKAIGVHGTYLLPTLLGFVSLAAGARVGMRHFIGGTQGAGASLRPAGLAVLVGLILVLLGASVELFGAGMLANMLGR